jgi:serine/threonine protein kinase
MTLTVCGTPLNMPPEVLKGQAYNNQVDVWSLGVVLFELLTGFAPFSGVNKSDLKNNLEKGTYKIPKKLKLSLKGLGFINGCLQFDPNKRLNWE